ncbi:hypothetical protein KFK09_001754 [Dendrobium nobile]|uniref:CCHC-type domain-containing protein n=1 Tax=Dendrobium nobile TaxID=94219 RepID=A0A8T3C896_DENNO|nr:hypothetical protein KFK09_001754 [Dendrobium nobile]
MSDSRLLFRLSISFPVRCSSPLCSVLLLYDCEENAPLFPANVCTSDETCRLAKVSELFVYQNFSRVPAENVEAGDICSIRETIADKSSGKALPTIKMEELTVKMSFSINISSFVCQEVVQATMNKDVGYDFAVDIWSLGLNELGVDDALRGTMLVFCLSIGLDVLGVYNALRGTILILLSLKLDALVVYNALRGTILVYSSFFFFRFGLFRSLGLDVLVIDNALRGTILVYSSFFLQAWIVPFLRIRHVSGFFPSVGLDVPVVDNALHGTVIVWIVLFLRTRRASGFFLSIGLDMLMVDNVLHDTILVKILPFLRIRRVRILTFLRIRRVRILHFLRFRRASGLDVLVVGNALRGTIPVKPRLDVLMVDNILCGTILSDGEIDGDIISRIQVRILLFRRIRGFDMLVVDNALRGTILVMICTLLKIERARIKRACGEKCPSWHHPSLIQFSFPLDWDSSFGLDMQVLNHALRGKDFSFMFKLFLFLGLDTKKIPDEWRMLGFFLSFGYDIHTKNPDGNVRFVKGYGSVKDAIDGAVKILTVVGVLAEGSKQVGMLNMEENVMVTSSNCNEPMLKPGSSRPVKDSDEIRDAWKKSMPVTLSLYDDVRSFLREDGMVKLDLNKARGNIQKLDRALVGCQRECGHKDWEEFFSSQLSEGIPWICFNCGKVGHKAEVCKETCVQSRQLDKKDKEMQNLLGSAEAGVKKDSVLVHSGIVKPNAEASS